MGFVSKGDQNYSVARIAMLIAKSRTVSEGDEQKLLIVRHLQRQNGFFAKS